MKILTFLVLFVISFNCFATVFQVGSMKEYKTPQSLYLADVVRDGDTIEIDAETYTGTDALAVWHPSNLLIKGVGGMPELDAAGAYIWGKGIWVLAGDNITVENIEFHGAIVPDNNGAGIRLDGVGMTVRDCFFHHNENGILTSNPEKGIITIEYCEFAYNGYGDGYSHNLYIGRVETLIFRFNYSHHAKIGHNLKSRATQNLIFYNRIMDEETGTSSRLIDLPNGGFSLLMGNLLMQGNNATNKNLIGFGLEGLTHKISSELYFINNTLVNKRKASGLFFDINNETSSVLVANNIFAGTGEIYNDTIGTWKHNIEIPILANSSFLDESDYDYHLTEDSPAIDYGKEMAPINGYSLIPDQEYLHPLSAMSREIHGSSIDAGAYEFETASSANSGSEEEITIFPNPVEDLLTISKDTHKIKTVVVYDVYGSIIVSSRQDLQLDFSPVPSGIYILKIELLNGNCLSRKIIKK